jgi:hypothetical protein
VAHRHTRHLDQHSNTHVTQEDTMPGKHPSIKKGDTYEALRERGYSKEKSARIANAQAAGTIDHAGRGNRKARKKS